MESAPHPIRASVIVVSDRCARGEETDVSGASAHQKLLTMGCAVRPVVIVPDDFDAIRQALQTELAVGSKLVLTSGGTGLSPRDLTPQATRPFIATELPALSHALTAAALSQTPMAALSRGAVGLTESRALIVNLPGSTGAVACGLDVLRPLLPHLFSQLHQDAPTGGYVDHF